mgnify:CR=1 FL=1
MDQKKENSAPRVRRRNLLLLLLIAAVAVGFYFGGQWLIFRWHHVSTDDAQVKGNLVSLSAKVSGRITQLLAEEGDTVAPGQVIVQLEKEDYATAQAQAGANQGYCPDHQRLIDKPCFRYDQWRRLVEPDVHRE